MLLDGFVSEFWVLGQRGWDANRVDLLGVLQGPVSQAAVSSLWVMVPSIASR
jgi:hypothetical protein